MSTSSTRPPIKKQYGSRKTSLASSRSSFHSSSSPSSSTNQRDSLLHLPSSSQSRSQSRSNQDQEWDKVVEESNTSLSSSFDISLSSSSSSSLGMGGRESPNTSPARLSSPRSSARKREVLGTSPSRAGNVIAGTGESPIEPSTFLAIGTTKGKSNGPTNLFSFFKRASPTKRTRIESSPSPSSSSRSLSPKPKDEESSRPRKKARPNNIVASSKSKPLLTPKLPPSKPAAVKLEQLYLDPFEFGSSQSTITCSICGMSYSRIPTDMDLHKRHHKRVVEGCDWVVGEREGEVEVLEEGVDWSVGKKMRNEGGKIVMMDGIGKGSVARKIKDVLATVDRELSSSPLLQSQLQHSKIFLFVTPQKKVVACAVVQRIKEAYKVLPSSNVDDGAKEGDERFVRFGEDEGAVFCSPTPQPSLLGIHRIWTCATHRRSHLASLLLDAAASRFIYACPIAKENRARDVAFSQPTGAGMNLARRWTGTSEFAVFVE